MRFESPWMFLLLLIIPLLIWVRVFKIKGGAVRFSTVQNAAKAAISLRQRLLWIPTLFRILALAFLIIAIARPQTGREEVRDISKGIAIEMVVDRSSSMGAELEYKGQQLNRLEVVKMVFNEFVMGGGQKLKGRPNDLIGMITFARYPDTVCPLTLAHGALPAFLKSVNLVQTQPEDGTAIGDALALAAARLKTAEESLRREKAISDNYQIKSKVVVLLSDGENNCGKRTPLQAAEMAASWGIKVYTVAISGGDAVTAIQTPFGVYKVPMAQRVDTKAMQVIAEKTGGFFRKAEDAESLWDIYEEIDKMERSEIESVRYIDYKESFVYFALAGIFFLVCEVILNSTLFRKIP